MLAGLSRLSDLPGPHLRVKSSNSRPQVTSSSAFRRSFENIGGSVSGTITGISGGLLRDAVASEDPAVLRGIDLYLIPAQFGAGMTIIAEVPELLGGITSLFTAAVAFAFRMLAWRLQWRVPQPMRSWSSWRPVSG